MRYVSYNRFHLYIKPSACHVSYHYGGAFWGVFWRTSQRFLHRCIHNNHINMIIINAQPFEYGALICGSQENAPTKSPPGRRTGPPPGSDVSLDTRRTGVRKRRFCLTRAESVPGCDVSRDALRIAARMRRFADAEALQDAYGVT